MSLALIYLRNSDVRKLRELSDNPATDGIGTRFEAFELPITTGTDSEQTVDFASAYVRLTDKQSNEPIGTYLVSQNFDVKNADTVAVDGKTYRIDLRFKTDYKPYSLTLKDVKAEYYLGTETPSWFSSDVILNDLENKTSSDQQIWMNNPLRYADQTFYQSSLGTLPGGQEYTVLQVVKNKGWMIPYVCCMFTVVGLVWQFGTSLLAYLEKKRTQEDPKTVAKTERVDRKSRALMVWLPTVAFVGCFAFYAVGDLMKVYRPVAKAGMRLDLFGQLPITVNGRVQPLDSFARNTARQLSKRETIKDGEEKSQPAIRWLADTVFEADGYGSYRAFRIEDPTILSVLDLPQKFTDPERDKNRFRYSLDEMMKAEPTLTGLIPNSKEVNPDDWSVFQKRLSQVATKLQRVFGAKLTFGGPTRSQDDNLIMRLEKAGNEISSPLIPLVVPTDDPVQPWISFIALDNKAWLSELATEFKAETTDQLASKIIEKEILPPLRDDLVRNRIIQRLISNPEFRTVLEEQYGEADPRELAQLMASNWDQFPAELLKDLMASEGPLADAILAQRRPQYERIMAEQIEKVNGGKKTISTTTSELGSLLMRLRPAYLEQDAEKFNSTLESYLAKVNSATRGDEQRQVVDRKAVQRFCAILPGDGHLSGCLVSRRIRLDWLAEGLESSGVLPARIRIDDSGYGIGHARCCFRSAAGNQPLLIGAICICSIRGVDDVG